MNPDRTELRAVSACDIAASGTVVHLEGDGLVKVFRIAAKDGKTAHWATSDLESDELDCLRLADARWRIEEHHWGLKQVTNVERCQRRKGGAQRGHIGLALRGSCVCPECGEDAEFKGSPSKTVTSLLEPVEYLWAYYRWATVIMAGFPRTRSWA